MNKLFTKIATAVVGFALAIGVGAAAINNKDIIAAKATDTAISGGNMPNGVGTTEWTTSGTGTYKGNGIKFDGAGDYIQSTDISSYNLKTVKVKFKAGYNGTKGSVLTFSSLNASGTATDSEDFTPSEAYDSQTTVNIIELSGSSNIKYVRVAMKSKTSNVGMKYCEVFKIDSTCTVTYNANGGSGTMTDSNSPYNAGATVTTLTNTFTAPSGYAFSEWNTDANGTGSSYDEGDTFTINANTTLYAIWESTAPAVTVSPTEASGYRGQSVTLTATPNSYITPKKYVWTTTNSSIAKLGSSTETSVETTTNSIVVTYGGDDAAEATVTVKGVDETNSKETEAVECDITVTASTHSLTLSPNTAQALVVGQSVDITATSSGTGAYSSADVTATTSDSSVVTVGGEESDTKESGSDFTLNAAGEGTATVTFTTSNGDSETISVTVDNAFKAIFGTTKSNSSSEVTDGSKYKTDYNYSINSDITLSSISRVYPQDSKALKFGTGSYDGTMTFSIPSTINSKAIIITNVKIRAEGHDSNKATKISVGGVEKTLSYAAANYTVDLSANDVTSFVITNTSTSERRFYIQSVEIEWEYKKTLSSIALSGTYQTTFTKGGTFNHDGMTVTATYSDSSTADVTSSATFSGYNLSNTGAQTVTVSYTYKGTTKTTTYSITVNYASVTKVELSQTTARIGFGEVFDYTKVTVTISPSNADPAYTWSVSASTVGDDYLFDESGLLAGDTKGTVTLKCESDADSTKFATLVVTITNDPHAEFAKESTSGYAGKDEIIYFTYEHMDDADKISIVSSNTSAVTVKDDLLADNGEGLVTINFVAVGSSNITISYNGGETLDTLTVTVIADTVSTLTWDATNFDVFSGTTLTTAVDSTWLVSYEMASGDEGLLEYGEYTLELGGQSFTLPHTWVAADSGKTLKAKYGGAYTSGVTVTVTQTINAVNMTTTTPAGSYSWAQTTATNPLTAGKTSVTLGNVTWTCSSVTNTSVQGSGTDRHIQIGKSPEPETFVLRTTAIDKTITGITVFCGKGSAGSSTISATVGGDTFISSQVMTYNSSYGAEVSGTGSKKGEIVITMTGIASDGNSGGQMYLHSIDITYAAETKTTQIANSDSSATHRAAQRAVVTFAKAFNTAMNGTNVCGGTQENLSAGWATASAAWTTFLADEAVVADKEYALNLIKYATAAWGDESDQACLERCVKTYDICVKYHGLTAFMKDGTTVVRTANSSISRFPLLGINTNVAPIIVIISMISIAAVGGYFFLRKRKED